MKEIRQYIFGGVTMALIGLTAMVLLHVRAYERLGEPGVKIGPLTDGGVKSGIKSEILMPDELPDYKSEIMTNNEAALTKLPADTSYRVRIYQAKDKFYTEITTVLMGTDRTSIHSPQICLPGQGWAIQDAQTSVVNIPMTKPFAYELPVNKLVSTKTVQKPDGTSQNVSSVYLYWYVDGNQYTASAWKRKALLSPRDMLTKGIMDRWAYITCFTPCQPGQEEATFERMKKVIADIVPEFQLVPRAAK